MMRRSITWSSGLISLVAMSLLTSCKQQAAASAASVGTSGSTNAMATPAKGSPEQVAWGRSLVLHHGCADCHGGNSNPAGADWLVGKKSPAQEFPIGACALQPGAQPCWKTRPRNLTPD